MKTFDMKKLLSIVALFLVGLSLSAQVYFEEENGIKFSVFQTTEHSIFKQVRTPSFTKNNYSDIKYIDLDQSEASHDYFGCGVSLTDASCWILSQMPSIHRRRLLKDIFTKDGLNLSMVRLNCGSSDYATALYNYNDVAGDVNMKHFSVKRDEAYMIPIIKQACSYQPDMYVYSAVWSEPGWMKDSGSMCGGHLLDEYLQAYANYMAAYIKAYKEKGIEIHAMSTHNEPNTDQDGGCPATLISPSQEIELIGKCFPEAFRNASLDTKIWAWDHSWSGWNRVLKVLENEDVRKYVDAVAWHPYSGEAPMMRNITNAFPDITMHLTERGPSLPMKDIQTPKWFADLMFDSLNYGCSSYSAWNLALDPDGLPNVGKFACGGLVQVDLSTFEVTPSHQYTVFKHFTPYVQRGAKILKYERQADDIASISFVNPDGTYVICLAVDKKQERQRIQIKYKGQYLALPLPIGTWSVTTIIIEP